MNDVQRALVTKELSKAQSALWAAYVIATRSKKFEVARALFAQHKALGSTIVELNGGPIMSIRELIR